MNEWLKAYTGPGFMPHGHCYRWQPEILWTHVISDAVIALAYYAIPIVLGTFLIKKRKIIIFPEIIALFVAFIFFCGTTHLMSIYVTWHPIYEPQGWLKAITALISITTAVVLIPKLPRLVALPGVQEAYEKSVKALEEVRVEKKEMESVYKLGEAREVRIIELKKEINQLLSEQGLAQKYLNGEDSL